MSNDIIYFVQRRSDADPDDFLEAVAFPDPGDFFFGNAHECAHWYLTFKGADYRVTPVPGKAQTWGIQFQRGVGKPYCATRFTVEAATEADALAAVRQEVLDRLLLERYARGNELFVMCRGEKALVSCLEPNEMRIAYEVSHKLPLDSDAILEWCIDTPRHSRVTMLKIIDLVAAKGFLSVEQGAQLARQIAEGATPASN